MKRCQIPPLPSGDTPHHLDVKRAAKFGTGTDDLRLLHGVG